MRPHVCVCVSVFLMCVYLCDKCWIPFKHFSAQKLQRIGSQKKATFDKLNGEIKMKNDIQTHKKNAQKNTHI